MLYGEEVGAGVGNLRKSKLFLANRVLLSYNFKLKSHIQDSRQLGSDGRGNCLGCGSLLFVMDC